MPPVLPLVLAAVTALTAPLLLPAADSVTSVFPATGSGSVGAVEPAGRERGTPASPAATSGGSIRAGSVSAGPVSPRVRTIRLQDAGSPAPRRLAGEGHQGQGAPGSTPGTTPGTAPGSTADTESGSSPATAPGDVPAGLRQALDTAQLSTDPFGVVGVTWTGALPEGTVLQLQVRQSGQWSPWRNLALQDDGPDRRTPEAERAGGTSGTEPVVVPGTETNGTDGAAGGNGVRVRVLNPAGTVPGNLTVGLVDAGAADPVRASASGAQAGSGSQDEPGQQTDQGSPTIRRRADWRADESLRSGTVTFVDNPSLAIVHHTAGSNSYSASQVPGIIRGIYAYHTKIRKWNDIGYNYLVDKYGRIWEGRHGGLDKVVRGAHALGFNTKSFGVSVLGDFEAARPPQAVVTGLTKVLSWKMSQQQIDPNVRAGVVSGGNPGYPEGKRLTRWTISGHGDVYPTACPGRNLKALLPQIRSAVGRAMAGQVFDAAVKPPTVLPGAGRTLAVSGAVVGGGRWNVAVRRDCDSGLVRSVSGRGRKISWKWPLAAASGTASASGAYRITVTGSGSSAKASATRWSEVLPDGKVPVGPCRVTRLTPGAVSMLSQGVRARTGTTQTLVVVASENAYRPAAVTAGALARALRAGLVATPSNTVAAALADRIRADKVKLVLLVGEDGTWGADVPSALRALGVEVELVGGADRHEVIAAAAARAFRGRTLPGSVVLVNPADPVPAVAGAVVAAVRDVPVLSVDPTGMPEATVRFLREARTREVIMTGTGKVPAATVVRGSAGQSLQVKDVRGATSDASLIALLQSLPESLRGSLVAVLPTGTVGLEALLVSALGRPLVPWRSSPTAVGPTWLRSNGRAVGSLAVAAGPSRVSTTELRELSRVVVGRSSPASPAADTPSPFPSATPSPSPTPSPSVTPTRSGNAQPVPVTFQIKGSGHGHGVGMSQYGAYGMALRGKSLSQIMAHYYTGSSLSTASDTVPLRVNLLHRAKGVTLGVEAVPGSSGWAALRLRTPAGGVPVSSSDTVSIVPSGPQGVKIFKNGRAVLTLGTATPLQVVWTGTWAVSGTPALARLSGTGTEGTRSARQYRYGTIEVTRVDNRLEAVNVVSLGLHYLRGIAEIPSSWGVKGQAALRAQAVAARTYALRKYRAGMKDDCRCHLYDSTRDQVFVGWSQETGTYGKYWTSAVSATARVVLTYGGALAEALYFSSSAGRTENAEDVWGKAVAYLTSVSDPYSLDAAVNNPKASWTKSVPQSAVAKVFGLPDVVACAVSSRTQGGAAAKVSAVSASGQWASTTGVELRSGLGLPSAWVSTLRPVD